MQFDEVLRTWSRWFEAQGIHYAIAGGNALRAWGHTRLTYDVDFVVHDRDRERAIAFAVVRPEHLIAMKVRAMKNSAMRVLIDAPDIAFLLTLPGLDRERVREYFSQHGLLKIYDELEKERH